MDSWLSAFHCFVCQFLFFLWRIFTSRFCNRRLSLHDEWILHRNFSSHSRIELFSLFVFPFLCCSFTARPNLTSDNKHFLYYFFFHFLSRLHRCYCSRFVVVVVARSNWMNKKWKNKNEPPKRQTGNEIHNKKKSLLFAVRDFLVRFLCLNPRHNQSFHNSSIFPLNFKQ